MAAVEVPLASQRPAYSVLRPGPFISGTTHQVLQLGQRPVAGDASDGEGDMEAGAGRSSGGAGPSEASAKRQRKDTSSGGGIGLAELLAAGFLKPGRNKVAVAYKGERVTATLTKDGMIIWQGKRYASPTAFTVAVKRQAAPTGRQGNDGWRSVLYEGAPLERVRKAYASQFAPTADDFDEDDLLPPSAQDGGAMPNAEESAVEVAPAETPATDQWVQCDRCDTWRVVPDSAWPALEAAESESWLCEDATWNLTLMPPHTPACAQ